MPRVNRVEKCRKSPGKCGKCGDTIAVGSPYVFWAFMVGGRGGPKIIRCGKPVCQPKGSELTQSEYMGTILRLQEDTVFDGTNVDDITQQRDELVEELTNLRDETQGKLDNMPEGLQQGSSGETLQERIDNLEGYISDLEGVDISEFEDEEPEDEKKKEKWVEDRDAHYEAINDELKSALESMS
jgi:hypothetical protein